LQIDLHVTCDTASEGDACWHRPLQFSDRRGEINPDDLRAQWQADGQKR
jgi:hypothetical protein